MAVALAALPRLSFREKSLQWGTFVCHVFVC